MKAAAVLLAIALTSASALADTVWLKNGVSIKANKAVVRGEQVEYIVGTTTYYIPLSQVDHIEKTESFGVAVSTVGPNASVPSGFGGRPIRDSGNDSQQTKRVVPAASGITVSGADELLKRILIYDHVDDRALSEIESAGNANNAAAAYAVAANYEYSTHKDGDQARRYVSRALGLAPNNVPLLCWYSSLEIEAGEYPEATSKAEQAVMLAPDSADAQYALGAAYYVTNRLPEAIAAWKRSLSLRPNEGLKQYVAKAERELAVEENFHQKESSHFTLLFQGQRTGFTLAGDVLNLLERQYADISRELNFTPQSTVTVVLYTEKEFFDVTESPSWATGVNDGKLRIPVKNVTSITGEFERVLKHELAHSFTHSMTRGNCPGWINEGIAQMLEPRNSAMYGPGLARLFKEGKQVPLRALESSFFGLNDTQSGIAYAESLYAMDYIRSVHGMTAVRRIIEELGAGAAPEDAVRTVTGGGYAQLERDISSTLKAQYEPQERR